MRKYFNDVSRLQRYYKLTQEKKLNKSLVIREILDNFIDE